MKQIFRTMIKPYDNFDYTIKRRAELTAGVYLFYLFYFVMNVVFFFDWFNKGIEGLLTGCTLVLSFGLYHRRKLLFSHLSMLVTQIIMAQVFIYQFKYFHFYGEIMLILFFAVVMHEKRMYKYGVYAIAISLLVQRAFLISLNGGKIEFGPIIREQNIFISFTIIALIGVAEYMNYIIKEEIDEKAKLERSTYVDLLTGLFTRQKFNEDILNLNLSENEYEVAIIDIDYFKTINDSYGHESGDRVLKKFTKLLNRQFRSYKAIYRWGGEEFVVINQGLSSSMFDLQLDIFRRYVDEDYSATGIKFTVSIGTARTKKNENFMDTFNRADQALYAAKESGRNNLKRGGGGYV